MTFNLNKESFDTLVNLIIAENQVMIKRRDLGLYRQKLIELDSQIEDLEKQNQEKLNQIAALKTRKAELENQKASISFDQYQLLKRDDSYSYLIIDLSRQTSVASLHHHFSRWGRVLDARICHFGTKNLLCGFVSFPNKVIDFPLEHIIDKSPVILILDPQPNQFAVIFGKMSTHSDLILKRHFSKFGEIDFVHKSETKFSNDTTVTFIKFKSPGAPKLIASVFHNVHDKNLVAYEII